MIEPFEARWRQKERECGLESIATRMVSCGECLLPEEASPCLTFNTRLSSVWDVFGPTSAWSAAERTRLAAYRVIGSDGAGNPLCVDGSTGEVWILDHEDRFCSRQYVNSSVGQLAECLLERMGEDSGERLAATVRKIDGRALAEGSFWWHEAATLAVRD